MIIIAILIIIFLMWKFFAIRAYILFQTTVISPIIILVGFGFIGNKEFGIMGAVMVVFGLLLLGGTIAMYYFTGKNVAPENKKEYYKALFLYGAMLFLRGLLIMMIIGIPFFKWLTGNVKHYHEIVLLNGVKVLVDEDLKDLEGNQYRKL